MNIGTRLEKAMHDAGFKTQKDLQLASGVTQPTISRILSGSGVSGPETETLRKLADACRVSFDWLNTGATSDVDPGAEVKIQAATPTDHEKIADEIILLITIYKNTDIKGRKRILGAAQDAQKFYPLSQPGVGNNEAQ